MMPECFADDPYRKVPYEGLSLISDPIHGYIPFTVPYSKEGGCTEKDIIDACWMQRLRYINQLQSARWVYPSAEHSRFVHSLGAMHLAGRFAKQLYPSLCEVAQDCPSFCFIEALLRVAVLLHDVGHGPFCHFFDHHFLSQFKLTHEKLGQAIIVREMSHILKKLRRSPSGDFAAGEQINPVHVAFLINKDDAYKTPRSYPRWLVMLRPLFSGIFTADNLDYVLRDSYMCCVAVGPVDVNRLVYYVFFSPQGLTIHKAGLPALSMFLNARSYLYRNVYYHRTVRSLDLHLKDIFPETIRFLFPYNPIERLDAYVDLTDWSLLLEVKSWRHSKSKVKRLLSSEWDKILMRDVKWKMAYDTTLTINRMERKKVVIDSDILEDAIRRRLPSSLKAIPFRVDIATQDPRPMNPLRMGERQIYVFDPSTCGVSKEALSECVDAIPAALIQCRVYSLRHDHDDVISRTAKEVMESGLLPLP